MRGHSPNITKQVEATLVFVQGHFPTMKPKEIQAYIKLHSKTFDIKENQVPSVRSIQSKLNKPENHSKIEKIKSDPLNRLWSVSLGMKHGISPEVVPVLLEIARFENESGKINIKYDLTIRKALWIGYLLPSLAGIIKRRRPKLTSVQRAWLIYCIAEQYSKLEEMQQVSQGDASGKFEVDTSDLDYTFLIQEDVSDKAVTETGSRLQFPAIMRFTNFLSETKRYLKIKDHPLTKEELDGFLEDVPQDEVDQLNRKIQKSAEKLERDTDVV
jgi:hypothetical protein